MSTTTHSHAAQTRNYTHNVQDDGFDRCVEHCSCRATRELIRECGEREPAISSWKAAQP